MQALDKHNEQEAESMVRLKPAKTHFHKPHWSATPIVPEAPASQILDQAQLAAL